MTWDSSPKGFHRWAEQGRTGGLYTLTAELAGFAQFRREEILLRAGANFQVDITMALGTLAETITVSGDSPMLEVARPSNVLNIDAQFQKALPLVEGKYWSDFLHMTPGVMSRPHNDGSGRQNYFGNAVDHRDAVVDMEGMMASNYNDSNINRTALSTEAVEDVQIKTGGVDAASPMGYGLVLSMISKSGGNRMSGPAGWTYQPFEWNSDNTGGNGTPATRAINQADFSFGGPIMRDRIWYFGAYRWQNNETTPSRIPAVVAALRALYPNEPFENTSLKSQQPSYEIWDITTRDTDPSKISLVGEITGTPPNSCGRGCGGKFIMRAHKGWWSQDTGYFYAASGEPGFRNIVVQIFDLKNPKAPKLVGRAWIPGLKDGEAGYEGQYTHHPIVDEENKRLYVGYRNTGGQAASFDISDPAQPKLVWSIDMNPPHRGPHTVSPIVYDEVPNFGKSALPRTYAFIVDEAGGGADMKPCANGVRAGSYMLDITTETKPFPVSVWQVPVGNFCDKGGRFGPHQSAETVNGKINRFADKIAWIAYFNAGVRVVDLSDPYHLKELGYYIPKTNQNSYPIATGQPVAIQMNDVDIDHRGLAYAVDRAGTGLFILEYTGRKGRPTTN